MRRATRGWPATQVEARGDAAVRALAPLFLLPRQWEVRTVNRSGFYPRWVIIMACFRSRRWDELGPLEPPATRGRDAPDDHPQPTAARHPAVEDAVHVHAQVRPPCPKPGRQNAS